MEATVTISLKEYESIKSDSIELMKSQNCNSDRDRFVIIHQDYGRRYVIKNATEEDQTLIEDVKRIQAHNEYLTKKVVDCEARLRRIGYLEIMANKNWLISWLLNYKKSPET